MLKVGDDPATEGTLLYTSSKILSADTELFLDGSFHDGVIVTFIIVTIGRQSNH
jgi:hypothetical protein